MEYGLIIGERIIIMFIILIIGVFCALKGVITKEGTKQLSRLALDIVNPLLIFMSYQTSYTKNLLSGLIWSFILSAVSYALCIVLVNFLVRKKSEKCSIERFATIYSNCAFIGIPLIGGLYGSEGVLYLTGYITFFNLLVWTHGIMTMKEERDFSSLAKALKSPSVIAVFVGLICFLLKIKIPTIPSEAFGFISSMNTPLAMIIAGATAAQTNIIKSLKNKRIFYVSFLKLLLLPAISFLVINLFPAPEIVKMTILVASACPTATTAIMFAIRFDKDSQICSEIFTVTTVFSCITMPLLVVLGKMIVK